MRLRKVAAAALGVVAPHSSASAQEWLQPAVAYTAEVMSVSTAEADQLYYLDNLDLTAEIDVDSLLGTSGTSAFLYFLNNMGGRPNDTAGTIGGVSNIEVGAPRLRLYEAWIQQQLSDAISIRAGLQDLNAEFYATEASALLSNPSFGIGPELAMTGPSGPSIFPVTSLALSLLGNWDDRAYLKLAGFNARPAAFFTADGQQLNDPDGHLLIAEAGIVTPLRLGIGAWAYTYEFGIASLEDSQPGNGNGRGLYLLLESPTFGPEDQLHGQLFLRAGTSWGDIGPLKTSWQAGALLGNWLPGRPESQLSLGIHQARLTSPFRHSVRTLEGPTSAAETGLELTAGDRLLPWLWVQPDLQLVFDPGGRTDRAPAFTAALRLVAEF